MSVTRNGRKGKGITSLRKKGITGNGRFGKERRTNTRVHREALDRARLRDYEQEAPVTAE